MKFTTLLSTVLLLPTALAFFAPNMKQQSPTKLSATANPVIATAAKGMSLLAPIFKAESSLRANILGRSEKEAAATDIAAAKKKNKLLIYTYGLSPFSAEAMSLLDSTGYQYTKIELGAEWFVLGGKEAAIRQALAAEVANGATSLPKIFVGGKCIGGCAELSELASSGELEGLLKKARVPKRKN